MLAQCLRPGNYSILPPLMKGRYNARASVSSLISIRYHEQSAKQVMVRKSHASNEQCAVNVPRLMWEDARGLGSVLGTSREPFRCPSGNAPLKKLQALETAC